MPTDVKQPVAWELHGKLRELVDMRPDMQREEWEYRFSEFWPHRLEHLRQSEARREMFDSLSQRELVQRRYASELDGIISNNQGWRAKISDSSFACSAFPICDISVRHRCSIEHRKGYVDINGRTVASHSVQPFFYHLGQLSNHSKDLHKAILDQQKHDSAINIMMHHLLMHRSGFYIRDKCPRCKKEFEALRVSGPNEYEPKFREYDDHNALKFEYDIGVIAESGNLKAIIEALNTHKMGPEKRTYANNQGYPWVEYSVPDLLANERKGIHSRPEGWLALEALVLKLTHSGASHCGDCTIEIERERVAADRNERIRRKINESEEASRRAQKELDRIIEVVENLEPGFTTASMNKMEFDLDNAEAIGREVQEQLGEAGQIVAQFQAVEVNASRKDRSFCSKTGLELMTEFDEMVEGLNGLTASINNDNSRCNELFARIDGKRQDLMLLREWRDVV